MTITKHESAKPSHYNQEAAHYDGFNEKKAKVINELIASILKKHKVKSVLDLTCGTGSQVFHLSRKGFEVMGVDINAKMIGIAKSKAKGRFKDIVFKKGDMRTTTAGEFDAVISIFNAVGHLTKADFQKAMRNINANLNMGGLYLFDNFNLSYLSHRDNITKLTIDRQKQEGDVLAREIQYSTIDNKGVLASFDIYLEQKGNRKPKVSNAQQTLQTYSSQELKVMLGKAGFKVMRVCNVDGSRFNETKSERMFIVAKKVRVSTKINHDI